MGMMTTPIADCPFCGGTQVQYHKDGEKQSLRCPRCAKSAEYGIDQRAVESNWPSKKDEFGDTIADLTGPEVSALDPDINYTDE